MQEISTTGAVTYTARAQRVFGLAQQEAALRGQRYMGPEHLLLGLLRERDSLACQTLKRLAVSADDLRTRVDARMTRVEPDADAAADAELHLTPRAHRVLALAYHEAQRLRHSSVGTEHILLGLVREREGLPGRLLARVGVNLDRARHAVMMLTGGRPVDFTAPEMVTRSEAVTIQGLLAALKHDGRTGKPVLGLEWLVAYVFASLMLLALIVRAAPWDDDLSFLLYMAFCFGVLRAFYLVINKMVASPKQRQAAQRLAQLHDKRLIGHLVDFTTWPDEPVRHAAKRALTRMLPQLTPTDATLLSPVQQSVLRSFLHRRYVESETDLQIATLKAYEQIGDARALASVSALAALKPRTANRKRVRYAAEECLPFLQQRRQQQQSSQTLLRPTQQNMAEPARDILLRPAAQYTAARPDELLRATVGQDIQHICAEPAGGEAPS